MAIDAQTAIGKLASIQTEAELRALIADVSVEAKGKLTLLWSGTFGKDANGNDIKMRDAVQQAADANKDLRIIGNTQAAAFLDSPDFEQAVRRIIGPQGTSDFINNPRTGAWATVSDAFVRGTSGEIVTWTANASFERVFGLVETKGVSFD